MSNVVDFTPFQILVKLETVTDFLNAYALTRHPIDDRLLEGRCVLVVLESQSVRPEQLLEVGADVGAAVRVRNVEDDAVRLDSGSRCDGVADGSV